MKKLILINLILPMLLLAQVKIFDKEFIKVLEEYYPQCIEEDGYLDTICAQNAQIDYVYISGKRVHDIFGIQWFNNIEELDIDSTSIQVLPLLPKHLKKLFCTKNNLDSIMFPLPLGLKHVQLGSNRIKRLVLGFPDSLSSLGLSGNPIKEIVGQFPEYLNFLSMSSVDLGQIELKLSLKLRDLELTNCNLKKLPKLPDSLRVLQAQNNRIGIIEYLPSSLITLCIEGNEIENLPKVLPPNLITLMIRENRLKTFPKFNYNTIVRIEAGGNCFLKPMKNIKTDKYSLEFGPNRLDCK